MNLLKALFCVALSSCCLTNALPTRAAQSLDTCTGFIDTLPATISTQGVWCLRHDLATDIASGAAINIGTNNVTIDCNDFKIGGLQAGPGSAAYGIYALNRQNATIRHCNIRGFRYGVNIQGGAGHLVEDNRLDNNLYSGLYITGEDNRIRRNAVYATGGLTGGTVTYGILAFGDITDNTVSGVYTAATTNVVYGIEAFGMGTRIEGNRVGGLVLNGGGTAYGIDLAGQQQTTAGNRITATFASTNGVGIYGNGTLNTFCSGNTIAWFTTPIAGCDTDTTGSNDSH